MVCRQALPPAQVSVAQGKGKMIIRNKIKRAREMLGMTQAELAAEIGVSRRTVEGWEAGRPCGLWGPVEALLARLIAENVGDNAATEWATKGGNQ